MTVQKQSFLENKFVKSFKNEEKAFFQCKNILKFLLIYQFIFCYSPFSISSSSFAKFVKSSSVNIDLLSDTFFGAFSFLEVFVVLRLGFVTFLRSFKDKNLLNKVLDSTIKTCHLPFLTFWNRLRCLTSTEVF